MRVRNTDILELELTYLAKEMPAEVDGHSPTRLVDVYFPADPEVHSKLRLRQKGDAFEMTKKVLVDENDASTQIEQTIALSQAEFDAIAPASNKRVEKDRFKAEIAGRQAEVDIFRGLLAGLVLIDFEFETPEEKDAFEMPACCLADVTQEDFIAGGNLAGKSYDDIRHELERFDYNPIAG